jgi:hypothetical protein
VGKLRNEAHYQFFAAVIALAVKFPWIVEKPGDLSGLLQRLFAKEDEVVDFIRKSDYSAKIADAAPSLKNLMKTYGNIIRKSYDEEPAAMTGLLQELEGAYAAKVVLIGGLSEWITEIRAASETVAELPALRNTEKAGKPHERMTNVRRETDSACRDTVAEKDMQLKWN